MPVTNATPSFTREWAEKCKTNLEAIYNKLSKHDRPLLYQAYLELGTFLEAAEAKAPSEE